jgi:peptidoglycan hydrolase-like protein with peptidoglycan-binding domain
VVTLQKWLMSKGLSLPSGATGYFGAQTKAAVASYQAANGITPATGYFGSKTQATVH